MLAFTFRLLTCFSFTAAHFGVASTHQRVLLVPSSWDPLHGGQRGEEETAAQGELHLPATTPFTIKSKATS